MLRSSIPPFFSIWLQAAPRAFVAVLILTATGCRESADDPLPPGGEPARHSMPALTLLVVEDPQLAAAVGRFSGEWASRTGGELTIRETTAADLLAADKLDADAVIYPDQFLGVLAQRELIVPVRTGLLENEGYGWDDVLPLVRNEVVSWAGEPFALSLGSPAFVLYYRTDVLRELKAEPPATWTQYDELAARIRGELQTSEAARGVQTQFATLEPLDEGWAGRMLLARAAAYACEGGNAEALFDSDTMAPRIAGPPFVRALEEMTTTVEASEATAMAPSDVRAAFYRGECAMAITWPAAADELPEQTITSDQVGVAQLPGAWEVYDARSGQWEDRPASHSPHVTLLGIAGRLASVTSASRNVPSAQRLLAWLTGTEVGSSISSASHLTAPYRESHLEHPESWVEDGMGNEAARQYALVVEQMFKADGSLMAPRIPGAERYLAALDEAVRRAVGRADSAQAALDAAAQAWRAITTQLGLEAQRLAYLRSVGRQP